MTEQTEQTAPTPKTFAGLTREQMAQHRGEFGEDRVKAATIPLGAAQPLQWVYRAPSRMEYDRYTETLMKIQQGKVAKALSADRALVIDCTIAPIPEKLGELMDTYPALPMKLAEFILKLAGVEIEVREETF